MDDSSSKAKSHKYRRGKWEGKYWKVNVKTAHGMSKSWRGQKRRMTDTQYDKLIGDEQDM